MRRRMTFFSLVVWIAVAGLAWAATVDIPPISNTLAKARGCRDGGFQDRNRIDPEWVSVQASDAPAVAEGVVRTSHVTHKDLPSSHISHDWNFDVALDPAYLGLHSDANHREPNGERWMEMEWETEFFPPAFFPALGDRVWMMGRWVFDCGHPPYATEFHPPKAVALNWVTLPGYGTIRTSLNGNFLRRKCENALVFDMATVMSWMSSNFLMPDFSCTIRQRGLICRGAITATTGACWARPKQIWSALTTPNWTCFPATCCTTGTFGPPGTISTSSPASR